MGMSKSDRRKLAIAELDERLAGISGIQTCEVCEHRAESSDYGDPCEVDGCEGEYAEPSFDGVYGVEVKKVIILTLAGGGPSAWIEYTPEDESATFYTTAPGYAESSGVTAIDLNSYEISALESFRYMEVE